MPNDFDFLNLESLIGYIKSFEEVLASVELVKTEFSSSFERLIEAKIKHFMRVEDTISRLQALDIPLVPNKKIAVLEELFDHLSILNTVKPLYADKVKEWEERLGSDATRLNQIISPEWENERKNAISYIDSIGKVWSPLKAQCGHFENQNNARSGNLEAIYHIESWLLDKRAKEVYLNLSILKNDLEYLLMSESKIFSEISTFINPASTILNCQDDKVALVDLIAILQQVISAESEYNIWIEYQRLKEEILKCNCHKLLEIFQKSPDTSIYGLSDAYEYAFYNALCREIFQKYPELQQFSGNTHEAIRKRYQELDKGLQELDRKLAFNNLLGHKVSEGTKSSYASERTERALIEHESNKKMKHVPIREFMKRAGTACQQLKPCFMMSPLSVAQFIPPGFLTFDIVIMDEASQIKPEEAMGAIARGKQFIVVGDPQQLGPSDFFNRSLEIEEENDEDGEEKHDIGKLESILDLSLSAFNHRRRLLWHYRSRHQSLIAYSNQAFYDSQLHVFPSAIDKHPDYGIQYIPVQSGLYRPGKGINIPEAELVVEYALAHMSEKPNQSLGIVAINKAQSELINEMLEKEILSSVSAQEYRTQWTGTIEEYFVKNLESVQGDERDVVFISTVYGKDVDGNFYQRYGPINNAQGHRRLNVLFTRAKNKTVVFSSMTQDMIKINENTLRGVRVLKDYLAFAQSGQLPQLSLATREPDSEFSVFVADRLKDAGYEVVLELGVSGFFIDIAVKHPEHPASFMLGIECDGFTYHSAKSARDRDRLRQASLENLGWRIYRIWSTDWFKCPQQEMQRLLSLLESIRRQPLSDIKFPTLSAFLK